MTTSAYQVGVIRDIVSETNDCSVFDATLDIIAAAKSMKDSQNSSISSTDGRGEDFTISTAMSLTYSIWHLYNKLVQDNAPSR